MMDKETGQKTERILKITLEIIYLLTGEDYAVVKKISGEPITSSNSQHESEKMEKTKKSITVPQLRLQINDQKILDLTNKIIHLLTGEEWEYLEDHKNLYKGVRMESNVLSSVDGSSSSSNTCLDPLFSQNCADKDDSIPEDCQAEDLSDIRVEVIDEAEDVPYMMDDRAPIDLRTDGRNRKATSDEHMIFLPEGEKDKNIARGPSVENVITQNISKEHLGAAVSSHPSDHENCSNNMNIVTCRVRSSKCMSHNLVHTDEKPFPCSECGKCFPQKSDLLKHQRLHTGEKKFPCFECGKLFLKESHLVMHLAIHTDVKPYPCSECGKCFTKESDFVRHQLTHTSGAEFSGSSCGKSSATRSGEKLFPCSECDKCFTLKGDLAKHQRIHTGERPLKCSECERCFIKTSDYVRHQWSHTGERPFQCSACGKCFAYKTVLINHQRIHTGEKPFSCSECGKSFRQKTHLMTHRRIHTSEKPFQCTECGDCFTYKLALVKHQRLHKV